MAETEKPTMPPTLADLTRTTLEAIRGRQRSGLSVVEPAVSPEERARQLATQQRSWARLLRRCGVPAVDADKAACNAFELDRPLEPGEPQTDGAPKGRALTAPGVVHRFVRSHRTLLLLLGPRGRGKTSALAHFVSLAARASKLDPNATHLPKDAPRFVKAWDLARSPLYGPDAPEERARDWRWLAIDELGGEPADERTRGRMKYLLDLAYGEGVRLVVATQLRYGDAKKVREVHDAIAEGKAPARIADEYFTHRYGAHIWDRFVERGAVVAVKGPNRREASA